MSNLADIHEAIEVITKAGNEQVVLLQCSAIYPTKSEDVHLRTMDTLKNAFYRPVGYSDHTMGILMSPVAVARGACMIEKHFTLSRQLKGPDHSYAIEPGELGQMVKNIRLVEKSLGSPIKEMLPEERKFGRRNGLYVAQKIAKNSLLTPEMIEIQRPATGVDARYLNFVSGRKIKRNLKPGDPIFWKDF